MSCPDNPRPVTNRIFAAQTKPLPPLPSPVPIIDVIIPAYNEEGSIALVVNELPRGLVRDIIVCNNNSKDDTANMARNAGAVVVDETRAGYGSACLRGMAHIAARPEAEHPDIVVFIDGDHSDYPEQLPDLTAPILNDGADLVIGSRALGDLEPGSMQPQQIFGNWLATTHHPGRTQNSLDYFQTDLICYDRTSTFRSRRLHGIPALYHGVLPLAVQFVVPL